MAVKATFEVTRLIDILITDNDEETANSPTFIEFRVCDKKIL